MENNQNETPKKDGENNELSLFGSLFSQIEKQFGKNQLFQTGKRSGNWFGGFVDQAVELVFKK